LSGISDRTRLHQATRKDAPVILRLEEDGMRSYAEALWGKWVPSSTPELLLLEGHEMIEWNGEIVGCVACEWQADHLRIKKLYVSPQYRRRGIGACVLGIKLRQAACRGLTLRLAVLSTNSDARRFYEREGMSVADRTEERITLQF
jgi:ribosomal protein S18 acetylase RimI-like enzyme